VWRDIAHAELPCNFVQIMENSVDPYHVEWLHGRYGSFLKELYFEQMERVEAGQDPICTFRDPDRNVCIDLPEREKFGGARAFRDVWLHESSIRYSPIRDEVLSQFGDVPRHADVTPAAR
jgi:phenylpropionate dioxygenase-like ring-hydroxylating dioxygenase large terminal subunit